MVKYLGINHLVVKMVSRILQYHFSSTTKQKIFVLCTFSFYTQCITVINILRTDFQKDSCDCFKLQNAKFDMKRYTSKSLILRAFLPLLSLHFAITSQSNSFSIIVSYIFFTPGRRHVRFLYVLGGLHFLLRGSDRAARTCFRQALTNEL